MATMFDQVCLDRSLWFMRVMMGVNTAVHPAEDEMVGRKTLRVRLSDGAEVLTQQGLRRDALHLAAYRLGVLCIATSYAVLPLPHVATSTKGRKKDRVGLGRPLGVKDTLVLG